MELVKEVGCHPRAGTDSRGVCGPGLSRTRMPQTKTEGGLDEGAGVGVARLGGSRTRRGVCTGFSGGHRDTETEVSSKEGGRDRSGGLEGRAGNASFALEAGGRHG